MVALNQRPVSCQGLSNSYLVDLGGDISVKNRELNNLRINCRSDISKRQKVHRQSCFS